LPLGDGFTLSAPETVHLAITARCNLDCPGCYAPRPGVSPELTTAEVCGLIDQWARMRVFQLAVGGGEPLLYPGLFEMLAHARAQGIVPNLTTNGTLLTADAVRRLGRIGLARINVSWNGPDGVQRERSQIVARALRLLLDSTLSEGSCGQVGVNVLVTPTLIPRLPYVLARLHGLGVRHVTVLRPKPPAIPDDAAARAWYAANRLRRADLLHLRAILSAWRGTLKLEVDSALVGLMADVPPALLRRRGIYGCVAGRRICTVWPDGSVSPCSFLADSSGSSPSGRSLSAGNVRQMPFAELWRRGENWGPLRDPGVLPQGGCAGCGNARQCGGAPCIARHERGSLFAGDAECPSARTGWPTGQGRRRSLGLSCAGQPVLDDVQARGTGNDTGGDGFQDSSSCRGRRHGR
jgi:radical SAM protein with 4Fe4S-binding SPASM domain